MTKARETTDANKDRLRAMSDGDDRDRPQMAGDDAIDSQALTGGDITMYRALVVRISCLSQDRPDLKLCGNARMLCDGKTISV